MFLASFFRAFLFWSCCLASMGGEGLEHPVYLSKTEIRYDIQRQALNIVVKIFSDDLQGALSVLHGKSTEIGTDREPSDLDALLEDYLKARLSLSVDDKPRTWEYKGRRQDEEDLFATLFFVQVHSVAPFKRLSVRNEVLHEYIDRQENIIVVQYAGEYRRASLRKNQAQADFVY